MLRGTETNQNKDEFILNLKDLYLDTHVNLLMQMKIEKSRKIELTLQNTKCIPTSDGMSSTILSPRGGYTLSRPTA
jgi:hypothetical protein